MIARLTGLLAAVIALPLLAGSVRATDGEWLHYGNDLGGMRYAALDQITADNVGSLKQAWVYRTNPGETLETHLQVTPLMVGDALYLCTATNQVIALDAETGAERWRWEPPAPDERRRTCRGVTYYAVPGGIGDCAERIFSTTATAWLVALDARTGKPCAGFGADGMVDLKTGMGTVKPNYYFVTSAPLIVRGRIVMGGWVADNQHVDEPPGVIRAYDAMTGAFSWAFDPGRPEYHGEPGPGETYTLGTPNSWAPMSGDEDLGLVYAPMGNATPDYWGAHRTPESEKFTSAVVALDAESGALRWLYRTVHHDVWDYDLASQPTLADLQVNGKPVPALIQPTKRGQVFVLDRRTGRPLKEVVERKAPQGPAPGDWLAPTQPFSNGMPDFAGPDLTEASMWGLTPFDQLWCRIKFRQARYDGPMTPPGTKPSITHPGYLGGIDWGGVSVDPVRQVMIANWSRMPNYTWLIPRGEADAMGLKPGPEGIVPGVPQAQAGTPFAAKTGAFLSPLGVPCINPPYAMLTAVDLVTGKVIWSEPFGDASENGPWGIPSRLPLTMGVPAIGGSIVTRSGLVFIGASMDKTLRAVDQRTGEVLWKAKLPAGGHATPMTYIAPRSGRQFVVIAAGGHLALQSGFGDYIIAFALPKQ
ncbi:MAG: pyrroloquinoline quinone-dependent dehydrogenase [Sphingomonadales bacterium]